MRANGFRSFWSPPVAPKKHTLDSRPSYRGGALGTAIFSKLPSRSTRIDIPVVLEQSQRFTSCVVRLGNKEILVVAIYGFATRYMEGKRPNDLLLASVASFIESVGLPFLICGDFNEPPVKLASFQYFKDLGAVEAFQWFESRFGETLPPTCAGSTRNDTAIIHPSLIPSISTMSVQSQHQFDIHTPLFIEFDVCRIEQPLSRWQLPKNWAFLAPPPGVIHDFYERMDFTSVFSEEDTDQSEGVQNAFKIWSEHVESAIDRSLSFLHRQDPVKHQYDGLPNAYKGRCKLQCPKKPERVPLVKSDRHGGYMPPSEVFGPQARLKIRQVRRLQSLYRRLKSLPLHLTNNPSDARLLADAFMEWKKIRTAKGYGHCWQNWILSFEAVPFLNTQLPSVETLEVVLQITKIDCDYACHEESKKRSDAFKTRMKIDQEHDFSRMTYKIIRSKEALDLKEVPVDFTIAYSLYRCRDKSSSLRLEQDFEIPKHARVMLGDAHIVVTSQQDRKVTFKVQDGNVSPRGLMRIQFTALTNSEITDEFARFWKPFWQRDSPAEQFDDTTWQGFLRMLDSSNLPAIPQIALDLHDPKRLMKVIKKLPSGKAVGPCGWSNDELKCLPFCSIVDLARIFEAVSKFGFGQGMMMAKTVLLSKIAVPTSMHHVRPVTILSSLYRLYSKVIFQITAHVWKNFFPIQISGGLPGRGVKEIAFAQKRKIEDFLDQGKSCGGLTMDLIKAFNTFGRFAVGSIMVRLGIPQVIVDSWIRSLSLMVRYPTLDGYVGHAITSTTGVPEGCSISVLAMLATSCFFYCRILCQHVQPYTYADNWSWLSTEQKAHFVAYKEMQQVVDKLRL